MKLSINDYDTQLQKNDQAATDRLLALLQEHHDYAIPEGKFQQIEIKTTPTIELPVDICVLPIAEPKLTIDGIKRVVCRHYGLSHTDLISARRDQKVAYPRMIGMYLARTLTTRSLPEIARKFGDRDHTTALSAVRKVEGFLATGHPMASHVANLRGMLLA